MGPQERSKGRHIFLELLLDFVKLNRTVVFAAVGFSMLHYVIQAVVTPKLLARVFTTLDKDAELVRNIVYFLCAFSVDKIVFMVGNIYELRIGPLISEFVTRKFVEAVLNRHRALHRPIEIGIIMEKIAEVRRVLDDLLTYILTVFLPLSISIVVTIVSVFFVNWKLALLAGGCVLLVLLCLYFLPRPKTAMPEREALTMLMEDIFTNIDYLTSAPFAQENIRQIISDQVQKLRKARVMMFKNMTRNQSIAFSLAVLGYIGCVTFLTYLFLKKEISVKNFESQLLTLGRLFEMAYTLAQRWPEFSQDLSNMKAMQPFLVELFAFKEKQGADVSVLLGNAVEFRGVSFSYPAGGREVLKNYNLTMPGGTATALVGPSGTGKSTLSKLVMDHIQPSEGVVRVGTVDLAELSANAISHVIANVPQNTHSLLKVTIYENIVFGMEPCGSGYVTQRRRVQELVDNYGIASLFHNDPEFLDSIVEKNGSSLSGGQKQVIVLLHALLNASARIVILDEPTSALDDVTRRKVIQMVMDLKHQGRTLIIITHDEDLARRCDQIVRFAAAGNPQTEKACHSD